MLESTSTSSMLSLASKSARSDPEHSSSTSLGYGAVDAAPANTITHHDVANDVVVNHAHPFLENNVPHEETDSDTPSSSNISYWTLVRDNRNFRVYLLSYLVTHAGEWFTYVASIATIERIHQSHNTTSRTSISILVSLRLLPNALLTSVGGVLADSYDRRVILMILDCLGSLVAWLFLWAYQMKSITALYVATVLQMAIAAIYEPNRSSIVTMLVSDEEGLKKAVTLSGLAWSCMTAFGSSMGGFGVEALGIPMCFIIDSISYFVSALFIWKIHGSYKASDSSVQKSTKSGEESSPILGNGEGKGANSTGDEENEPLLTPSQFFSMTMDGIKYLKSKPWGPFVLFKLCAALIFGAADVLNVSFSERGDDGEMDAMEGSSQRLGLLFAFVGVGCFIGPIIVEKYTHMDQAGSLERACVGSFFLMAVGCWGLSQVKRFLWVCIFTSLRSAGSSIVWINSSLLLQKSAASHMLGRVMAVDYALATLSEAFSAICAGVLQDNAGMSAEKVSFLEALLAIGAIAVWTIYLKVAGV
eukprot:CAMPEP_0183721264 /NCGR_PEP_ID=MMETSP0737-20130205/13593_1 /TAXON_ID=385413 /ORGANISM="Thalassiosira miniscula, Strain CCMP1093" /LENGTH=530 /DNA_ID=CAMNT_0025951243 /DNA_START=101 /DNA_END=1693 /DNA_ORIENTATION=+